MKLTRICVLVTLLMGVVLLSGCNFSLAADVTPPPGYQAPPQVQTTSAATSGPMFPVVPPDPAKGAATYVEKCAPCHGVSGMGDGPNAATLPNPVTALGDVEVARTSTPAEWFDIVTNGNLERFMPPFRSLSDRQRWDVVAYAFSLSSPPDELARGAEVFQAECASCHGATAAGEGPQAVAPMPDLTEQERMAARSESDLFKVISEGVGERMPAYADRLAEEDRWAVTSYLRSLTFVTSMALQTTPPADATPAPADRVTPAASPIAQETEAIAATATISETVAGGTISGLVATGAGDPADAGLEVNLHAFEQMNLVYTATTTLRSDGTYVFEDLEMQPGLAFLSTIEFDGVVYGSDVAVAEDPGDALELPIQVFETSTDTSALSVDRLHYFFEFVDEDTLRVLELYVISNSSDKTITAPEKGQPLFTFKLPPGSENLQFENGVLGERYVETAEGFGDTLPIKPGAGNYQVLYSYDLPYDNNLELVRTAPLITQAVVILAPQEGVRVKGDNLEDAGTREIQGVQYQMYNAPALGQGGELRLTISGRPGSGGFKLATSSTSNLVIGLASLGIVLLIAGAWLFTRNRRALEDSDEDELPVEDGPQLNTREAVMDAILALDDLFQEGTLPEAAYLERRAVLKARLKELMSE